MVFLLIGTGYGMYRAKWIAQEHIRTLTRILINVAVPCTTAVNMFKYMTPEMMSQSGPAIMLSLCSMAFGALVGFLGGWLVRAKPGRRGLIVMMSALSNSLFIGFPMCVGIYGDAAIPYVLYFYIANTTLLWTLGLHVIQSDAAGGKLPFFSISTFKRLATAPLISFIVCMALLLLGVRLPNIALKTFEYLGGMMTPLSLIIVGVIIARAGIKRSLSFERGVEVVMLSRFLIAPAVMFFAARLFGMPPLGIQALTLMVGMPTMSQAVMLSEQYGADVEFAAKNAVISTLLCMITIPATAAVMQLLV